MFHTFSWTVRRGGEVKGAREDGCDVCLLIGVVLVLGASAFKVARAPTFHESQPRTSITVNYLAKVLDWTFDRCLSVDNNCVPFYLFTSIRGCYPEILVWCGVVWCGVVRCCAPIPSFLHNDLHVRDSCTNLNATHGCPMLVRAHLDTLSLTLPLSPCCSRAFRSGVCVLRGV